MTTITEIKRKRINENTRRQIEGLGEMSHKTRLTYAKSGVDMRKEDIAMERIKPLFKKTFEYRRGVGKCVMEIGHFAGLIQLNQHQALAIKTDGVGTKVFIAEMMKKYDTIGIDCVAMNVNDVICTGAEPISFEDYIAIQDPDPDIIEQIAIGLCEGARISQVNIVGGETAVVPEVVRGVHKGKGLDLVGMCVGIVDNDKIIDGSTLKDGDLLLGISSSGLHSNGYTLARKALLELGKFDLGTYVSELGRTLGEELLEPTYIYVPELLEMLRQNLHIKLMAHITSRGFMNLNRVGKGFGYVIDSLPSNPPAIFKLIQRYGNVSEAEMYTRFNMGIGMCLILPRNDADSAMSIAERHGKQMFRLGYAKKDSNQEIQIRPVRLRARPKSRAFSKY
jgi:phosphoribosylformylglycinamidine cyclo-ligase